MGDSWRSLRLTRSKRAVQLVRIERQGSKFSARNVLPEVGMPAVKAALAQGKRLRGQNSLLVPAGIVGGELFSLEPDADSKPRLAPQDFVTVSVGNAADWVQSGHRSRNFDVVPYASLSAWLIHIQQVGRAIANCLPG
jgi:hypothetical protein